MIISSSTDYREAARRKLPPFLFHYIDGGAYAEHTLRQNVRRLAMPVALSPVGLTGMYARRGEVQAAQAAEKCGVPFTLSTVSVCSIARSKSRHRRVARPNKPVEEAA
jgi:L-lactate dehydrogenase (cytochrome)